MLPLGQKSSKATSEGSSWRSWKGFLAKNFSLATALPFVASSVSGAWRGGGSWEQGKWEGSGRRQRRGSG